MSTIRHQAGTTIAGEKTGGQFKGRERTAADGNPFELNPDLFEDIREESWEEGAVQFDDSNPVDWTGAEVGLDGVGISVVTALGDPSEGEAHLTATRYENPVGDNCLTQEQWNVGYDHLLEAFRERYGVDVTIGDEDVLSLDFTVPLKTIDRINPEMASTILWERSSLVQFANESDPGTYGSPHIYAEIAREIDGGFFPGRSPDGTVNHTTIQNVRDDARRVLDGQESVLYPELNQIAQQGYCLSAEGALEELEELGQVTQIGPNTTLSGQGILHELLSAESSSNSGGFRPCHTSEGAEVDGDGFCTAHGNDCSNFAAYLREK